MNFTELQNEIITSEASKIVVMSSAAAGKTAVLTERVRYWLKQGVDPSEICCLTFTNMAAQEMRNRLAEDYKDGMFIGTIHSLACHFLRAGGFNTVVNKYTSESEFDKLFPFIEENPQVVRHYSYVCSDETQDISQEQFDFIFNIINPDNFFAAGDSKQCIYEALRKSSPIFLSTLAKRPDVKVYDLNENFRNKINILSYAKSIIKKAGMEDTSISRKPGGVVFEGEFDIDMLVDYIENTDDYKDWCILCYTNTDINYIKMQLKKNGIDSVSFRQSEITNTQLKKLMNENKVKLLTVWSAKGLQFKNVAVYGVNWQREKNRKESYRVDYVAATRAMNTLLWLKPQKRGRRV